MKKQILPLSAKTHNMPMTPNLKTTLSRRFNKTASISKTIFSKYPNIFFLSHTHTTYFSKRIEKTFSPEFHNRFPNFKHEHWPAAQRTRFFGTTERRSF